MIIFMYIWSSLLLALPRQNSTWNWIGSHQVTGKKLVSIAVDMSFWEFCYTENTHVPDKVVRTAKLGGIAIHCLDTVTSEIKYA